MKSAESAPRARQGLRRALLLTVLTACGCQSHPPLTLAPHVDLPRFMGEWYVLAALPTRIERNAYGATESYRLGEDGRIPTVFMFHEGSFSGPLKRYTPVGYVRHDGNGAVWGMRFIWPIRADYRVMYVDEGYTQTVIGRQKRDYAWIMARTPVIASVDYERLRALLQSQGYDTAKLRRVPQLPVP